MKKLSGCQSQNFNWLIKPEFYKPRTSDLYLLCKTKYNKKDTVPPKLRTTK